MLLSPFVFDQTKVGYILFIQWSGSIKIENQFNVSNELNKVDLIITILIHSFKPI